MKPQKSLLAAFLAPGLTFAGLVSFHIFAFPTLLSFAPHLSDHSITPTQLMETAVWLSATWIVIRGVCLVLIPRTLTRALGGSVPQLVLDLSAVLIWGVSATAIVGIIFEVPVGGIWATSGAVGIVMGLALRETILDVFVGTALNADRSMSIGDWVEVHARGLQRPLIGCIQEITWRTTRLRTADGTLHVVPNRLMGEAPVTNFDRPSMESRFELDFTLGFDVASERAMRVLCAAALCAPHVLQKPRPKARVNGVTADGVEYRLRYWLNPSTTSPSKGRHAVCTEVLTHLHSAGLQLAHPKQDVFHTPMPNRQLDLEQNRRELLDRITLFADLDPEDLDHLACSIATRQYAAKKALVTAGETGKSMFMVVEGVVDVLAPNGARLASLSPGAFFGERSLLTGEPRLADVRARTDVVAYELKHKDLRILTERRPEVGQKLTRAVAAYKTFNNEDVAADQVEERVNTLAQELLEKMRAFFGGIGK
jgi:small-conductance mechanosensitive channel/CRP-like cAMP-binding protein